MFTGIITATGTITKRTESTLSFKVPESYPLFLGASIAVNGTCLTVVRQEKDIIHTDILAETWKRTSLGNLHEGNLVNLELPAAINGRLDGHIVQGHVDGVGHIQAIAEGPLGHTVEIIPPPDLLKYMVIKGSISVDGIALTITNLTEDSFSFEAIPHTWQITNLNDKSVGDTVNLEVDVITKYVERLMMFR